MLDAPLAFQPGTAWEYGIGIDWLGVLIEKISGKRLERYFQDHIFGPLGMTDTTFELQQEKPNRALSHDDEGGWRAGGIQCDAT